MEANGWTLVVVGTMVLALLVLILWKNHKDKLEFFESLHASDDMASEINNVEEPN